MENGLPLICKRKEKQEWEALLSPSFLLSVYSFGIYMNILASRNRDSGAVETYIPDTETAFDWLNYHS